MSGLDIFALVILLTILLSGVAIFVTLGVLPGRIAKQRGHPNAEAIAVGSWVALLVGGVLWPLILIWAYYRDPAQPMAAEPVANADTETDQSA